MSRWAWRLAMLAALLLWSVQLGRSFRESRRMVQDVEIFSKLNNALDSMEIRTTYRMGFVSGVIWCSHAGFDPPVRALATVADSSLEIDRRLGAVR